MAISSVPRPASLVIEVGKRLARELQRPNASEWLPPERTLAEQLGVSRTVVREATKRLELQGLVEVRHGVGIRRANRLHHPINGSLELLIPDAAERLRQSLEVRLAIEPEVARLAAERGGAAELQELRHVHERLASLASVDSLAHAVEEDIAFHRAVAQASGNDVFQLLLETLSEVGRESRRATIEYAGMRRAVAHHEEVLVAVESHDGPAAAQAMRRHIEIAMEDLQERLRRNAGAKP